MRSGPASPKPCAGRTCRSRRTRRKRPRCAAEKTVRLHGARSDARDMTAIDLIKRSFQSETASELPIVIYETDALSAASGNKLRSWRKSRPEKARTQKPFWRRRRCSCIRRSTNCRRTSAARCDRYQRPAPDLARRKVLIVDDDIRNISPLTGALEQHGITCSTRRTAKTGSRR